MKLRELAVIKKGIDVKATHLESLKPLNGGNYFDYLMAENFSEGKGKFISERNLKKMNLWSKRIFLDYGDFIIYKKNGTYRISRFEKSGGMTVLGNDLIAIQTDFQVLQEFLGLEKNRKYFFTELDKVTASDNIDVEAIGNIEIMTDNIRELDDSNKSEEFGIRTPLSKEDLSAIRLTQKPITLDNLLKRIKHKEILLDTEFQISG